MVRVRTLGLALAAVLAGAGAALHASGESRAQAESLLRKVEQIQAHADAAPGTSTAPLRTTLTETEVNSWFAYHAPPLLPEGLARPRVTIVGGQQLVATAIVDLDAVAKSRASGRTFDIWNLVGGRVPVTVRGLLHAIDGRGRFEVQEADISGVAVPLRVLDELVRYYSQTPDNPGGVSPGDPFELPAGIDSIVLRRGAAILVQ